MTKVAHVCTVLDQRFPARLAEEWDNTGLLLGRSQAVVRRLMVCLTITDDSVAEAVERQVDLIVTHHPFPFRAAKRFTAETTAGRMLLDLVENQVAVYSPHTSFDSAATGINQQFAERLGLNEIAPLRPDVEDQQIGIARYGHFESNITLAELERRTMTALGISRIRTVAASRGESECISTVAVACGSAGGFLPDADRFGCQAFVTGEATFHTCLDAESRNMALLLPGHYATERFAVERLADELQAEFPDSDVWASRNESDPLQWTTLD